MPCASGDLAPSVLPVGEGGGIQFTVHRIWGEKVDEEEKEGGREQRETQ